MLAEFGGSTPGWPRASGTSRWEFHPWRWLSWCDLFGALDGLAAPHDEAQWSPWQYSMPQALPGLHRGTGFRGMVWPAQALAGQGLGCADPCALRWPTAPLGRLREVGNTWRLPVISRRQLTSTFSGRARRQALVA